MKKFGKLSFNLKLYLIDSVEDSTPSMTPRPFTRGDSTVLVIVVPVLAAGALLVITISVVLIVLLKRTCKLPSLSKC